MIPCSEVEDKELLMVTKHFIIISKWASMINNNNLHIASPKKQESTEYSFRDKALVKYFN
jgi:hypothetical protein